jgi:hypothetical protein
MRVGKGSAWILLSSLFSANLMVNAEDSNEVCEEITESPLPDDDHFFNFHQHDERLDPNKFVKVVFGIMSKLKPDPIKKVQLDYNPILHHLVGPYKMRSTVSHETPKGIVVNCFDIVIQIHDTNECEYHGNPEWEDHCDPSTTCVNTEGGYYCACDEGKFAVKDSGNGKCNGEHDSTECCGVVTYDGSPHGDYLCRGDFKCHSDACAFNECDENAVCIEGEELNTYSCACQNGYRDMSASKGLPPGRQCMFVDHCEDDPNACPIGCDCVSVTNEESDGFYCSPSEGYATYYPENDYEWVEKPIDNPKRLDTVPHMCVPLDAPEMTVAGPAPLVLRQGEKYVEHGVTIIDESTANLQRRFETNYDDATDLMDLSGFVKSCGTSVITYTLRTPWLSSHKQVTATRVVEVLDQDECTYDGDDDTFRHKCHFPAECRNVACGTEGFALDKPSYVCECAHKGFEPHPELGCVKKKNVRRADGSVIEEYEVDRYDEEPSFDDNSDPVLEDYSEPVLDENGEPVLDENGQPVFQRSGLWSLFFGSGDSAPATNNQPSGIGGQGGADRSGGNNNGNEANEEEEEEEDFHPEFHDHNHCPERLAVAFSEIQWCVDEFNSETLTYYRRVIKTLYEKAYGRGGGAHGVHGIPPPYEWDKPYRLKSVEELRELSKSRGLASPLGASVKSKDELLSLLATADYDAFENEYK